MKSIILALGIVLCQLTIQAQNLTGFFLGPQMNTANYNVNYSMQKTDFTYGFQAGVMMKVPFDKGIFFVPTIFYSMKGYKVKFAQYTFPPDPLAADNEVKLHTLELGGLLQFDLGKKPSHAFVRVGPTLDFQLFGHEKFNLQTSGSVSRKMTFGYGDYGHYSANALAQLGFETESGFVVSLNYTYGLTSISNADGGPKILHRCIGFSIGKFLNAKKIILDTRNRE